MSVTATQQIFGDLRNPKHDVKIRAAQDLLGQVLHMYRELQPEKFGEFYTAVNQRIAQLVVISPEANDKIGGIIAVEQLIAFSGDDSAQKTTKFSNYLRAALKSNDNEVLVYASRALGRLAVPGGALTAELVESEVKSALEWLQSDKQESRRFAAVLVIRELAKNSPTLLYSFVPQILDSIWIAVRDPRVLIRETASEAIATCFDILKLRDESVSGQWFDFMYQEALSGFKSANLEYLHGSLLVIKDLVTSAGLFMRERFSEACDIALQLKSHRDSRIRGEIVLMIPTLANYSNAVFVDRYVHKFMVFLLGQLKKEKERNASFIAIGSTAIVIESNIAPYLQNILSSIKECLKQRLKTKEKDGSVFQCIRMLADAVEQSLTKFMEDGLLDHMLACGLSLPLQQALVHLASKVKPMEHAVQEKLLDMLSLILCDRPFRPVGCPPNKVPPIPPFAKEWQQAGVHHGDAEIALALNTLGSFDFKGWTLNEFIRDVVLRYIKNRDPAIRKAAALTCCSIYTQDPIIMQTSFHALGIVRSVVTQLVSAALGDSNAEIRREILYALDSKFDKHLAEQQNVRKVLMALNDPDFEVRKAAMEILGRLTIINPGYIYPPLRKSLQNFTMSVSASEDATFEEEGARLVSLCAVHAPTLAQPFVSRLIDIFLPKAAESNPTIAAVMIKAIGDLCTLGGRDLEPYIPKLMPLFMDAIQDLSSPLKRDAALRSMGQLTSNSGYVIQPYLDYPQLLDLLTTIIKNEPSASIRKETTKLLGVLGALDPYKHQQSLEQKAETAPVDTQPTSDVSLIMQGLTPSNDEYYPQVVMNTLLNNVLKDSSLVQYHSAVIEAVVTIFKTLGLKCVSFLPQIVPTFISVIHAAQFNRLEQYFNQLSILVSIVREHIRNYNDDLVDLVKHYWTVAPSVQVTTLSLVEALARALGHDFFPSMVKLLPLMMKALEFDNTTNPHTPIKVLHTVLVFGHHAEQSMWLVLPKLVRVFQNPQRPPLVRKTCIETMATIVRQTNVSDFSALILSGLREVLSSRDKTTQRAAYDCILTFFFQYPDEMDPFVEGIRYALVSNGVGSQHFDSLSARYRNGEPLPQDLRPDVDLKSFAEETSLTDITLRKLMVNQEHLKASWEASIKSTKEDWQEWIRRFSIELLRESPSNALRACAQLASVYTPLAKDLFNSAFVSCWTELYDQYQEDLIRSLEIALMSDAIPPEILQMLLNLAEFMEHDDKPLPVDIGALGKYAAKCHAYAKALHYKELEFEEEKSPSVVEALIVINNQLQQTDAAVGILRNAQKYRDFELKETWFERLGRWDEALEAYEQREEEEPSMDVTMGKMRCLHALGEWEALSTLAQEKWSLSLQENKKMMAPLAAAAAWGLNQWDLMETYINNLKKNSPDKFFFGAIAAIHREQFAQATQDVEDARLGLDTELTALLSESYTRAYSVVVRVQMLAELEEIITYKKNADHPEKQMAMREMWKTRLQGCEGNVETWQRMLKVRALVLSPQENIELWIKFANLCRKSGRTSLAEKTLANLQKASQSNDGDGYPLGVPEVTYAQHKYNWAMGETGKAMIDLHHFTNNLADRCSSLSAAVSAADGAVQSSMNIYHQSRPSELQAKKSEVTKMKTLLSKCFLRLGQWQTAATGGDWTSEHTRDIVLAYQSATQYNPSGYKAWHAWALANFEIVNAVASQTQHKKSIFPQATINDHVIPAIEGFLTSISLSQSKSTLQDTLRLLALWFAHGASAEVQSALTKGFPLVSMDTWLEVTPQLIARINQPNAAVREMVQKLLCDMGKVHPQALVFPLTVAMKSNVKGRADAAKYVMDKMRNHSRDLVDQTQLVSKELIRVAVLWHELWHEGCEEASRLYFGDHDTEGMFRVLAPLHKLLEDGPQTLREISFTQAFGRELAEAKGWCDKYRETKDLGDINMAWDLYHSVYRRIDKQLSQMITLDLKYISPQLETATDLELAVPGTYQSGKPIIRIQSFNKVFSVIASKQRPRKMTLRGSDGQLYTYVLKGHEDIRQDERVMQLFGLVNTLLSNDVASFKRHLNIQRFPAVPLSQNCGLLGWVPNSDTFHNLIKEYRENRRILLNIEHRIMLQMAPQYDNLTLMQKVEVFNYAMDNTTGKDLYRVLWLKSRSSEAWLERRTNYTRSLAVMSMVGYILGLGDRHPSNLMLDRATGKVIHIDFGDCFEVAMHREKYPERVPFRLTRMLTFAMEVSNIDGTFKISSEAVMRVIRDNRESLLAVLEAFIHDPLLNWRLTTRESPAQPGFRSERRESLIADTPAAGSGPREPAGSYMNHLEAAPSTRGGATAAAPPPSSATGSAATTIVGPARPPLEAGTSARPRGRTAALAAAAGQPDEFREVQNARALQVLARVKEKLHGTDFKTAEPLDVEAQVARLIAQATNIENTCQHYIGWCSFW